MFLQKGILSLNIRMKKIILPFLLSISLFVGTFQTSSAIYCSNCSTVVNDIIDYAIQSKDYVTNVLDTSADTITSVQQTFSTTKQVILDPMKDAMTLVSIAKSSDQIRNLVLGGLENGDSLLISNPEMYLKNQETLSKKANLGVVAKEDGAFSDSILKQVISASKSKGDVESKLKALSHSSIPEKTQDIVCDDAKLRELAEEEVNKVNNNAEPEDIANKAKDLYQKFGCGEPGSATSNKAVAQNLAVVGKSGESGDWDTWLTKTGGDNAYSRTVQAQLVVEDEAEKKKELEAENMKQGGGIISKAECTKEAQNDETGEMYTTTSDTPCLSKDITNLGSQLNGSFKEALNTPLAVQLSGYGKGAFGIFADVISIMGTAQQLSNAVSGASKKKTSNIQAVTLNYTPKSTFSGSSGSKQVVNQAVNIQNQADQQKQITQMIRPANQQLTKHLDSLNGLASTDMKYLADVNEYLSKIASINTCRINIENLEPYRSGAQASFDFYNRKNSELTTLKNQLTEEINTTIPATKTLIQESMSRISSTSDPDEILSIFNNYQDIVDEQHLLKMETVASRSGESLVFSSNMQLDGRAALYDGGNIVEVGGDIPKYTGACQVQQASALIDPRHSKYCINYPTAYQCRTQINNSGTIPGTNQRNFCQQYPDSPSCNTNDSSDGGGS